MGIWVGFSLEILGIKGKLCRSLCVNMFLVLLDEYLRMELLGHMVSIHLTQRTYIFKIRKTNKILLYLILDYMDSLTTSAFSSQLGNKF